MYSNTAGVGDSVKSCNWCKSLGSLFLEETSRRELGLLLGGQGVFVRMCLQYNFTKCMLLRASPLDAAGSTAAIRCYIIFAGFSNLLSHSVMVNGKPTVRNNKFSEQDGEFDEAV